MNKLNKNQLDAINQSINNDFESGIHFHATGTGKSWIAMEIVNEYNNKYPLNNILWLCEKKSILLDQFNLKTIKERNFEKVINKFTIFNYVEHKNKNWVNILNTTENKPILLIINRAYLTSQSLYKNLKININFIIHDECHSIINKTTQEFYKFILNFNINIKCIGFSATPYLDYDPYKKLLSTYSIYDAFMDKIIVPPKIQWITTDYKLNDIDNILIIQNLIIPLTYKKIIVWCGMINFCNSMAELWSKYFTDYIICVDTSVSSYDKSKFLSYEDFYNLNSNGILFCAGKHREGSDIKNLDCCIFLDNVKSRCAKLFIQSIGRVLRLDKNNDKKYGLIIDLKSKSSINIISKINKYLNIENNIFPWKYTFDNLIINSMNIKLNTLDMVENNLTNCIKSSTDSDSIEDLTKLFIRTIPNIKEYNDRLTEELNLIHNKKLINHLIRAIDILKITKNLPHVTRGSCGSSLICYLLGITHIDPVKYNIKFARFLNEHRNNLPDIDLDFPHKFRDEVFFQLENRWHNKIARISNKVHYHEKSALRQAIRNAGIRKFISKYDLSKTIKKLPLNIQTFISKEKTRLEETFRCYSLHCGGIVYFPEGIPKKLLLKSDKIKILNQIILDKYDIANDKTFKIDILSSRALSQLYEINNYQNLNFDEYEYDAKTYDLLCNGFNIGLTLCESPLMRLAFLKVKPQSIFEIAICLAIIRPAADQSSIYNDIKNISSHIIFDDDAIDIIAKLLDISDADADKFRRGFAKNDKIMINEFKKLINHFSADEQKNILNKLNKLSSYSFCKAHAFSYAQLIYKLAFMKANHPQEFWKSTLNNCQSSYKKWVHIFEAAQYNVYNKNDISIYAINRKKTINNLSIKEQLIKFGYWEGKSFYPDCFFDENNNKFNGIIASIKIKSDKNNKYAMIFLGVDIQKYIQLNIIDFKPNNSGFIGVNGIGYYKSKKDQLLNILTCEKYNTW